MAAGLREANPEWTSKELRDQLIFSGSQYNEPDNELGYGIPDFTRAMFGIIDKEKDPEKVNIARIYPNPLIENQLLIEFGDSTNCTLSLYSSDGKVVGVHDLERIGNNYPYSISMELLNPGIYLVELQDNSSATKVKLWKK